MRKLTSHLTACMLFFYETIDRVKCATIRHFQFKSDCGAPWDADAGCIALSKAQRKNLSKHDTSHDYLLNLHHTPQVEIDNIISNTDEWQTWPGYATLAFRLIAMVWFLVELRRTYHHSQHDNLNFIQHFGAFFLMWFIYLPVLALISTQVSPLWRYKTILSRSWHNSFVVEKVYYLI